MKISASRYSFFRFFLFYSFFKLSVPNGISVELLNTFAVSGTETTASVLKGFPNVYFEIIFCLTPVA